MNKQPMKTITNKKIDTFEHRDLNAFINAAPEHAGIDDIDYTTDPDPEPAPPAQYKTVAEYQSPYPDQTTHKGNGKLQQYRNRNQPNDNEYTQFPTKETNKNVSIKITDANGNVIKPHKIEIVWEYNEPDKQNPSSDIQKLTKIIRTENHEDMLAQPIAAMEEQCIKQIAGNDSKDTKNKE